MKHLGRPLGVAIVVACFAMTAWSIVSLFVPGSEAMPDRPSPFEFLTFATIFLVFPLVGLVVVWKRPDNMIGWLFLVIGLLLDVSVFSSEYSGREVYTGVVLPGSLFVAWLGSVGWFIAGGAALPLAIATFPTGRHLSHRWQSAFRLTLVALGGVIGAAVVKPGPIDGYDDYFVNPLGIGGPVGEIATAIYGGGMLVLIVPVVLAIASIVVRFRRSQGVERQQLKWLLVPAVVVVVGTVTATATTAEVAWRVMLLGLAGVPVGAGIAILRHRLYDIDVVIRRTLVYGAVIAVLAAVYVSLVLVLQAALSRVTGGQGLPVALSTLAIAALFGPVRARVRGFVDRRFYRSRYDAQRTVEAFAARLRDEVELEAVAGTLAAVASRAVRPASTSVWLRRRP